MSLRLLPAIIMDDEDDDGNFTKWMSSYWGHGAERCGGGSGGGGGYSRERKRSFRRPTRTRVDRRASLPTVSQLDAMKLNRLHAAAVAPAPSHAKSREEKGEVGPHQRARRTSSDENGRSKSAVAENRIGTIPELTESFQRRLYLQDRCTLSPNDDAKLCPLCHDNVETAAPAACLATRLLSDRRRSADEVGGITAEKQQQQQYTFRRQLSLRRHR
ncbi:leukemia NUP98 fusion partner 1 [Hippocampus comes]|uniref:leukemia NUP98 fusion partner 1 n=1 Tax=Hippocampus comes TaxID=109280 RepID=UPI00094E46BE|nr:PREDICTED: leukemia NUP98 fusion partner 1-like [Hippocampus comes]